jgi:uncharacterized protein YbjQ (UPF0145 family)
MRHFLVILSAAVTAGLVVFFTFNVLNAIGVMGGSVVISMDVFVALIAMLTLAAAGLALLYRRLLVRGESRSLQQLADRIVRLEAGNPPA